MTPDTVGIEDWVPLYEALLRRGFLDDPFDQLQEEGYVYGERDKLVELRERCLAVGLDDVMIGSSADGPFLYQTRRGLPAGGNEWTLVRALFSEASETRLRELGHRAGLVKGRGFRVAYCCDICGDRLYLDTERGLVCGELANPRPCPGTIASTQVGDGEDWAPLYEGLVCLDELDELREGGKIYFGWNQKEQESVESRCREAEIDVDFGFDADTGFCLYLTEVGRRYSPASHQRCHELVDEHRKEAKARGHIPVSSRVVGARAALFCASCGDRFYVDADQNLVGGELVDPRPCPNQIGGAGLRL